MTKFKRLMALAAVSMIGIQLMGAGTAFAVESECDFSSDSLEITLGTDDGPDSGDAGIWVDADGMLYCEDDVDTYSQASSTVDSITVAMDDDDSDGVLTVYLDDDSGDAAEWPEFDTFDIDVTTRLIFDGSSVNSGAANKLRVTVGKDSFAFAGTSGTYSAAAIEFADGGDDDSFDASKATVRVYANDTTSGADSGSDVFKGGAGNDRFYLSSNGDDVIVYGNGGNDLIETGSGDDQGWGGAGYDTIDLGAGSKDTAAPGAGDDDVSGAERVSYGDLSEGIEWTNVGGDPIETAGAAGDDEFDSSPARVYGSLGDDVIVDDTADLVSGGAGDDYLKVDVAGLYALGGAGDDFIAAFDNSTENLFYGNAGNDVLRGKGGDDTLRGGPGSDQAWGGNGSGDLCTAEVLNRCELIKK